MIAKHKSKPRVTPNFADIESALRAALAERDVAPPRGARKQLPVRVPKITVIVNSRPADLVGHNVYTAITVTTISQFEAELEALAACRKLGLRHSVIVRFESWS